MTTVVVDTRVGMIASDNMATTNEGDISVYCKKLYKIKKGPNKGDILASVGNEGPFFWFLGKYESDSISDDDSVPPYDMAFEDAFEAVILTADNRILVADKWFRPYELQADFYASGSGGPFAYGAMKHGASITSAIRVACECDPHSSLMGKSAQVMKVKIE